MRLLILDDAPLWTSAVGARLRDEGHELLLRPPVVRLPAFVAATASALVILDPRLLPSVQVLPLCRAVHRRTDAMLLVVSPAAQDRSVRCRLLEAGADAVLPKPVQPDELLAHLHALLRRCPRTSALDNQDRLPVTADLVLDVCRQCLVASSGERALTEQEYRLLRYLVQCDGAVVGRDELLDAAWERNAAASPREVDVYVRYLRRKLEPDPRQPRYLLTVWGKGYRYVLPQPNDLEGDGRQTKTSA